MSDRLAYYGELYTHTPNDGYVKLHVDTMPNSVYSQDKTLPEVLVKLTDTMDTFKSESITFTTVQSPLDIYK